ncbi:chemotaxis protein CheB [Psychrobacter sp. I-STPA6b]|uniref:chemotaxis protein CheB n=1 Tax=Psychrobacter sp. I-STPA6b TaxID=2585718 RepID=UPI001D0CB10E|nr:chemotaxis protein CheB [Psychrobacter sp. I-STPA6b]
MTHPAKKVAEIRIMVVAEKVQQRLALSDTIRELGLCLVDSVSFTALKETHLNAQVDLWLLDGQLDEALLDKLDSIAQQKKHMALIGFSQAPYFYATEQYLKWQRKLRRKLALVLDLPELCSPQENLHKHYNWKYLVVLGASMGGPAAIKDFLDALSPNLPISILVAHHFDKQMLYKLPRILSRHNSWQCQIISFNQLLQAGQCAIVPVDKQVACDSTGYIVLEDKEWQTNYKPCIGELLHQISNVYGKSLITIIFSGMGSDGSQHLDKLYANHSQIWAQTPESSICPAQPQAVIDSGFCQFSGTPQELAQRLTQYVMKNNAD